MYAHFSRSKGQVNLNFIYQIVRDKSKKSNQIKSISKNKVSDKITLSFVLSILYDQHSERPERIIFHVLKLIYSA